MQQHGAFSQRTKTTTTRRLGGLAAATACVAALGLSGPATAQASSSGPSVSAGPVTLQYSCKLTDLGTVFNDPWTAEVSADLPTEVAAGASVPGPAVTAKVTTGADAADQLRALNVKTLEGTSAAGYSLAGAVTSPGARTASLTVPQVAVPDTGVVTTTASGTGAAETAASTPGTITVSVGDFTADLTTDSGFVAHVGCTLNPDQDATLGTISVV
ncbi:DUF6801 domain-containing protein [Luteipulveratus halotolerans]|uniref:DUF6801 domain-containing protein n=1 Tax=Luteipulveratus halotolerans TaxID=1631356 RepID=A0A0L6CGK9_9MICO|nr:DUF6801 domain-containing protein [Luteipulveratus halotolerans]KNX36859.1 hypothetical protein VV01_06370 [Luteipulveratus halotolerans]